ncbi:MAG: sulfate/thiosulfate transport system substrate-binding protein, partial [Actinomycetota bacterium]|nr:sulfate/thiosulfate transport system substrate-binding protein [Actinomycetota bacterium]
MRPSNRLLGTVAAAGLVLAAGCSSSKSATSSATGSTSSGAASPAASSPGGGSGGPVTLNLVAYSTPQPAYVKLIAAFQKTPAGAHVKFTQSYGASGDQANSVVSGQAADVVEFSLETDMSKLVKKNLVAANWNANDYKGFITDSVVSFVVRKGNPKGIKDWPDLIKPGVKVLTPNPFSSGSARWNILGAYGAQIKAGKTDADATTYLK